MWQQWFFEGFRNFVQATSRDPMKFFNYVLVNDPLSLEDDFQNFETIENKFMNVFWLILAKQIDY